MNIDTLLTWLIGLGIFLPGFLFLALYVGLVRIRTWAGWNAVILMVALVALTGLSFTTRLLGRPPLSEEHRGILVVILISVAFWQRLYHLLDGTFNWRGLRRRQHSEK
jgi:hypothetical protein